MSGSFSSTSPRASWRRFISLNETSCAPSEMPDQDAGVLLREEALGDDDVEVDGERHRRQEHHQGDELEAQGDVQRAPVAVDQRGEEALDDAVDPAVLVALVAQEARAHHRRQGQRHHRRHHHGDRHGHGEFAEQPADDAAHQQQRDEHRDQRGADRHDGEADFAGALDGRVHRALMPSSMWRKMFSSITMASSTTNPTAMVSAISDRLSRL